MEKIAIISDVNAGLDYIGRDPQIPVLRSVINFGEEHLVDGVDITADQFYERLLNEQVIPSTSAPTVGEAMELIEKLIKDGYTSLIMYSISYQLSSIGQMVETLREDYNDQINIYVVDTKTAAYLQGYLAVTAKEMVDAGKSVKEIIDYSNYLIENSHAYFVVDNLNYLVKNGRISGAAGFLGGLLKIKPVLEMTKEGADSVIIAGGNAETFRQAVDMTKPGGYISNVNFFDISDTLAMPALSWGLGMADKTIRGGFCPGGALRIHKMLEMIANGRVDTTKLITHTFNGFDKIEDAFKLMDEKPKDLIKPIIVI